MVLFFGGRLSYRVVRVVVHLESANLRLDCLQPLHQLQMRELREFQISLLLPVKEADFDQQLA